MNRDDFDNFQADQFNMNSRGKLLPMSNKDTNFMKKNRPQTTHPNQKPPNNFRLLSGKQDQKVNKYQQRPQSEKVKYGGGSKKNHGNVDRGVQDEMEDFYNANDMGIAADTREKYANILSKVEERQDPHDASNENSNELPSQDKSSKNSRLNASEYQRFLNDAKNDLVR